MDDPRIRSFLNRMEKNMVSRLESLFQPKVEALTLDEFEKSTLSHISAAKAIWQVFDKWTLGLEKCFVNDLSTHLGVTNAINHIKSQRKI